MTFVKLFKKLLPLTKCGKIRRHRMPQDERKNGKMSNVSSGRDKVARRRAWEAENDKKDELVTPSLLYAFSPPQPDHAHAISRHNNT